MAFKVFLSYGNGPGEQVLAWRLQTLATAHGIHVFVPQRNGAPARSLVRHITLTDDVRRKIDQSDCVLAIITGMAGPAVEAELTYASTKRKVVIPVVQQGAFTPAFLDQLPRFEFSPWNLGQVESDVIGYLKEKRFSKQNQQAVGALVAIGLGLFLLSALSEK